MVNVHLVDGTFELFRCFHGAPRHTNTQGAEVGAVRGLLHTLLSLLKGLKAHIADTTPAYVAVAFDPLPTPRGPATTDPGTLVPIDCSLAALAWHGLDDGRLRRVVTRTGADDLWPRIERWRG